MTGLIPHETIESRIHCIRGRKVMLDRDLAALYEVETRVLNQAAHRNIARFPEDFMFQLTREECASLKSQNVILKRGRHFKYLPYAFTENGVAMLSSVLNSEKAIRVNIQIMRAFTRMRNLIAENKDLRKAIERIEQRLDIHDRQIQVAFSALKSILQPEPVPLAGPAAHYSPDGEKRMGFGKKK